MREIDNLDSRDAECCFVLITSAVILQNSSWATSNWSSSQPMDQGVIEKFRRYYKKFLLHRRLEAMEEEKEFEFTLLRSTHCPTCLGAGQ